MCTALRVAWASLFLATSFLLPAYAEDAGGGDAKRAARLNKGLISIVTDSIESQSMRYAADLAAVLDGEEGLRIMPVAGRGPVEAVNDILYLRGIDAGIVPSDVIAYMDANDVLNEANDKLAYVAKLGSAEVHVIARKEIASLADLNGKHVNAGSVSEPRFITTSLLFKILDIEVNALGGNERQAVDQLRSGKADAIVILAKQPSPIVAELARDDRFKLLSVQMTPELENIYSPAMLSAESYAGLTGHSGLETISVSTVFAVFNWRKGAERYYKLRTLTNALYAHIGDLQTGDRNAQWADVNFASDVPGWTRYTTADDWLAEKKNEPAPPPSAEEISAVRDQVNTFIAKKRQASIAKKRQASGKPIREEIGRGTTLIKWNESQLQ